MPQQKYGSWRAFPLFNARQLTRTHTGRKFVFAFTQHTTFNQNKKTCCKSQKVLLHHQYKFNVDISEIRI